MAKNVRLLLGILFIVVTVVLTFAVASAIFSLRQGTLEVRIAKEDFIWSIHQVEVEIFNLYFTAYDALENPDALYDLDIRYAVLLSRTDLFKKGEFFEELNNFPSVATILVPLSKSVEDLDPQLTRVFRNEENALRDLIKNIKTIKETSHSLTLAAHQDHVKRRVAQREELADVFYSTEILLSFLAVTVIVGFMSMFALMTMAQKARVEADYQRRRAEANSDAKSRFLSNMSHELRTPLNAILGFAQLLKLDEDRLNPEQRQNIEEINSAGEHLLSLINDILDLSKIESGQLSVTLESSSIKGIIADSIALVSPLAASHRITIKPPTSKLDYLLNVDRTRLVQVLTNFLTNAVKYNQVNGWVSIELSHDNRDNMLKISVVDNGIGISENDLSKVFMPFERFANDVGIEGTGIGLALSQQITLLMQGQIGFKSKEGEGSCFWVAFPTTEVIWPDDIPAAPKATPDEPALENTPITTRESNVVLYVEDNDSNIKLMQAFFSGVANTQLYIAADGESGIRMARKTCPDIILLDLNLPKVGGLEVYQQLRQISELQSTPIFAVSANINGKQQASDMGIEFSEFLLKPLKIDQLKDVLGKYLSF